MTIELNAPWNLVCLSMLIPFVAVCIMVHRRRRVAAAALGLPAGTLLRALAAPLLLGAAVTLVAVAAARPLVETSRVETARTDAEAYVIVDTSISMLARRRRHDPSRIDLARRAISAVVAGLPTSLRVGVAVMPQAVLPVLTPTTDRSVLRRVLAGAATVGALPAKPQDQLVPPAGTAPTAKRARAPYVATNLAALKTLVAAPFFRSRTTTRLAVLVTDGESDSFTARSVAAALGRAHVSLLVVKVGSARDLLWRPIHGRVVLDRDYTPATGSYRELSSLARSFGTRVFTAGRVAGVTARVRRLLGSGPEVVTRRTGEQHALGPYFALAALVLSVIPFAQVLPGLPPMPASRRRRRALAIANPSQSLLK